MMKNGATFQLACIAFLRNFKCGMIEPTEFYKIGKDTDQLKSYIQNTEGMTRIIQNPMDNEEEIFMRVFQLSGRKFWDIALKQLNLKTIL